MSVNQEAINIDYSDDGKGLDEETLSKIFDPFYTTCRNLGNTGLGMHIVFNLITQLLNGKIQCQSTLGKGLTCHISLPLNLIADDQKTVALTVQWTPLSRQLSQILRYNSVGYL